MAKFGNIVQAKQEMSMTKEQLEERKEEHREQFLAKHNPDNVDQSTDALRKYIKDTHKLIVKMEAEGYDLEKRLESQEYELKELNERQRQVARNEARKSGLDPDSGDGKKPKVQVMARGERQIDRRNFSERRKVFLAKVSIPHFPNKPPPKLDLVFKVKEDAVEEEDDEE